MFIVSGSSQLVCTQAKSKEESNCQNTGFECNYICHIIVYIIPRSINGISPRYWSTRKSAPRGQKLASSNSGQGVLFSYPSSFVLLPDRPINPRVGGDQPAKLNRKSADWFPLCQGSRGGIVADTELDIWRGEWKSFLTAKLTRIDYRPSLTERGCCCCCYWTECGETTPERSLLESRRESLLAWTVVE